MRQTAFWVSACALAAIGSTCAFVPAHSSVGNNRNNNHNHNRSPHSCAPRPQSPMTALFADKSNSDSNSNSNQKSSGGGFDESMRNKLLTESIAPWRTLRLFLYGSLGSGAFIGGLINGSGAIANSNSPDFNLQTELVNLGIDFGFVILMGFAARYDLGKQSELQSKVDEKLQRKKEMKTVSKAMKERERVLQSLPLEITVGADGSTQTARVSDLQTGAKQHMIIVAGPRKACKDALIGANLLKMDFALSNVLVVPYETDDSGSDALTRPSGGFGDKPSYETQPYIARTTGGDWDEYIRQEIADAVEQNGESVRKDGIAIVVANNGSIIRRGVGTVPWRRMVEELEETVNPTAEKGGLFG